MVVLVVRQEAGLPMACPVVLAAHHHLVAI
jgi:hypothetical protein